MRLSQPACEVIPLDEAAAHRVGAILARAAGSDLVDGAVVDAAPSDAVIVTSDRRDITQLLDAIGSTATIVDV